MPYRDTHSDVEDQDDDDVDRDAPDPSDMDDENADESDTVPCPYCRKPVWDGAELCPHCKSYLSDEDTPRRKNWYLAFGVVMCLAIVVVWVLMRGPS